VEIAGLFTVMCGFSYIAAIDRTIKKQLPDTGAVQHKTSFQKLGGITNK